MTLTQQISRLSAVPAQVKDILNAETISEDPNSVFFESGLGRISRITITGLLVSLEGFSCLIDDGSGKIALNMPEELVPSTEKIPLGGIIFCTGRMRQIGLEKYIRAETIKQLHDPYWITYRKFETALFRESAKQHQQNKDEQAVKNKLQKISIEQNSESTHSKTKEDWRESIIATIKLLDVGDGADTFLVMKKTGTEDDSRIQILIKEGSIFEIKPGKIKVLE